MGASWVLAAFWRRLAVGAAVLGLAVAGVPPTRVGAAAAVPSAPTGVSALAGDRSAVVSWSAASNGGSVVTGYRVTASPGGATATTTGVTTVPVTGLVNGTAYTFTVVATNSVGNSPSSAASNTVVPVGQDVTYAHDAAGRLSAVFDTAGNGSKIAHDAAGNITAITRLPATTLAVAEVSPPRARVGASVDLFGTRLGTDPQAVTVSFAGTSVHPSSVAGNRMAVTVPAGAVSGTLMITAGGQTATWSGFQVVSGGPPAIGSVSALLADPGDAVTVAGSGFDAVATNNRVEVNGTKVPVSSATATQLTVRVPPVRVAGAVRVSSPSGDSAVGPDLLVPPAPFTKADVAAAMRMTAGTSTTVTIGTAQRIGLVLVDLPADRHSLMTVDQSTFGSSYDLHVWAPDLRQVGSSTTVSGGKQVAIDPAPRTGTYELEIDPQGTLTGSVRVSVNSYADVATTVTVGGTAGSLTTAGGFSRALFRFAGTAGQRVYATVSGTTSPVVSFRAWLESPTGARLESTSSISSGDTLNGLTLPFAGTYTVVLAPSSASVLAGSVAVKTAAANPTGTTTIDGPGAGLTFTTAGQVGSVTFSGVVGQRVWVRFNNTYTPAGTGFRVSVGEPNGATLAGPLTVTSPAPDLQQVLTLPLDGLYTVFVDPDAAATGSSTVTVTSVPPDASIAGAADSQPHSGTVTFGQNTNATFGATTGQRLFVQVGVSWSDPSCGGVQELTLTDPAGHVLTDRACQTFLDTFMPAATGTYLLAIHPRAGVGTVTVTVYQVPADAVSTATVGGPAATVATTVPGQNAAITFPGTANQSVAATLTATTFAGCGFAATLFSPADQQVWSASCLAVNDGRTAVLPVSGTYRLFVDPGAARTGSVTFRLTAGAASARRAPVTDSPRAAPPRHRPAAAPPLARFHRPLWTYQAPAERRRTGVLTGTVRGTSGASLGGVTLRIDDRVTRSRADGRFRLTGLSTGTRVLTMDGRRVGHGLYQVQLSLHAGTTVLPYTPYLPATDTAHEVAIDYPTARAVVLTNPAIPGLEVHIPAGVRITDADGRPVRRVGITPIPVSRPPIPMPQGVQVPVYYSVQPAGGRVSGGDVRIVYPNYRRAAPGTTVNFWHYEKENDGWEAYGTGYVDGHGYQVQPAAGTVVHDFDGAMINAPGWLKDAAKAVKDALGFDGDPVDLGSGLFQLDQTDLAIDDVVPLAMTRSYNSGSGRSRPFGFGFNEPYDAFLSSDQQWQQADLNLPSGSQIHFARTSAGTSYADAIMAAAPTPTEYQGASLSWNGNGWDMRRRDGTVWVYGDVAPLQSIRDRLGNTVVIQRTLTNGFGNADGDITTVRSPNGFWLHFTYGDTAPDGRALVSKVEDNAGRSVSYTYTSGRLHTVTDPDGGVTTYGYDASGRLASTTDARNHQYLSNVYDTNGRVHAQTVDGGTYTFDYTLDGGGKVTAATVTDPLGHVRTVGYDAAGYLVDDTVAAGTSIAEHTHIARNATTHIPTDVTDPLGRVTHSSYDPDGHPLSTTQGTGALSLASSGTYNGPFDQPDTVVDTNGQTTTIGYDLAGNVHSLSDPLHHGTTIDYRPDGQPATITDATNRPTTVGYSADNQPVSTADAAGNITRVFRDAANRPTVVTLANGLIETTTYDAANLVTATTDAAGNTTHFAYDPNGNLTSVTDPKTHAIGYTYDEFDRLTLRTDQLSRTDSYTYDAAGNLTTATDRLDHVSEYRYDELGRATFVGYGRTGTAPNVTYESTLTYTYDGNSRLTKISDSTSGSGDISFGYDDLDRVTTRTDSRGVISYFYDPAGRPSRTAISGQPDITYGYDGAGRLTSITQGAQAVGYTYDDADRARTVTQPGGLVTTADYDSAGNLAALTYTRVVGANTTALGGLTYTYNGVGQRTGVHGPWARLTLPADQAAASYDAANRATTIDARTLDHDNAGNLTRDGPTSYTWNARGQLTSVADATGTTTLGYDAAGSLASTTAPAGTTTQYRYNGTDLVAQTRGGTTTTYLPNPLGDGALTRTDPRGTLAYLTDAQDTTLALAPAAGPPTTTYTYDPFGTSTSTTAADPNSIRYTGRPSTPDLPADLQNNRARYLNPATHGFLSEDPAGPLAGDGNLYSYANTDAVDLTDPTGQSPAIPIGCAAGAILRDTIGFLAGKKHSFGDFARGAFKGCVLGATLALPAAFLRVLTSAADTARLVIGLNTLGRGVGARTVEAADAGLGRVLAPLTTSERRAVRSLQRQIEHHMEKLNAYRADPYAFDNKGLLAGAPDEATRRRIILGRIRHLEAEINEFSSQIAKILGGW